MANLVISKDGVEFKEIPDTEEMQQAAEAKGYKRYLQVTKDGKDIKTIPATDEMASAAFSKGYKTLDQIDSLRNKSTATNVKETIDDTIRGISQGVTMGFGDEILGAAGAIVNGGRYQDNRDAKRREYAEARERSPVANTAGEVGGSIVTGFAAPGIGTTLKGSMGVGAASGLGNSEADLTKGDVLGATRDTALGAGMGAAGYGAGKAAEATIKGGTKAAKTGIDYLRAAVQGSKEGAKEGAQVMPGTLGSVAGGIKGAVEGVIETKATRNDMAVQAGMARKILSMNDLKKREGLLQAFGSGKTLETLDDSEAITLALMLEGDNPVKRWASQFATTVDPGNLSTEQYQRLLNTPTKARQAARDLDPRKVAEELVPDLNDTQQLFEGARSARFRELQDEARKGFTGDVTEVNKALDEALAEAERFRSIPASVKNVLEDVSMLVNTPGDEMAIAGTTAFDNLQRAREFVDDTQKWSKKEGLTQAESMLRKLRGKIDEALKISPDKVEADTVWKKSAQVEGKFFDQTEFKNPDGSYAIDTDKVKRLLGNNDTANRFRDNIASLEEFANTPGISQEFKDKALATAGKLKKQMEQMDLRRDLQSLRQAQGPTRPAVERLGAQGKGGSRLKDAVQAPNGFIRNIDEFDKIVQQRLGASIDELDPASRSKALKMFIWYKRNEGATPEAVDRAWNMLK